MPRLGNEGKAKMDNQKLRVDTDGFFGELFVPGEDKFFRGDRGANKAASYADRMDSLEKTLEFVSEW